MESPSDRLFCHSQGLHITGYEIEKREVMSGGKQTSRR